MRTGPIIALLLVAACGGDEVFEPQLASNERLLSTSSVASLGKDDETFNKMTVVGDLDGDGIDDAVIRTVYYYYYPDSLMEEDGGVYVAYGGAGLTGNLDLASLPRLTGAFGLGGTDVAPVGDVDGDGLADFLVVKARTLLCAGNLDDDRYRTGAYLVYGSAARLTGSRDLAEVSTFLRDDHPCSAVDAVAGLGDLDGDGTPDFAVGRAGIHPGEPNATLIFYGRGARLPATVDLVATADAAFSWPSYPTGQAFSSAIAPLGDVDGDGYADFVIREQLQTSDLHLVRGGATRLAGAVTTATVSQTTFTGANACVSLRRTAAALGDLDGDGADDFAFVGCQTSDEINHWKPIDRIFYGRRTGFPAQVAVGDADASIKLDEHGTGHTAMAGGDLDGDGLRDLVVGDTALNGGVGGVRLVLGNGSRLAGEVDPAPRGLTYVGRPRHGTNCDFVPSEDCVYQEQVGYDFSLGDLTGDHKLDILAEAGADYGIIPLGVHGSATERAYVLTPFP